MSRPRDNELWPGVALIHEIFGVKGVMRRRARRVAEANIHTGTSSVLLRGVKRCLLSTMRSLFRGSGQAGVDHDFKESPDVGHSLMNDGPVGTRLLRPLLKVAGMDPDPTTTTDTWMRIFQFFDGHLT